MIVSGFGSQTPPRELAAIHRLELDRVLDPLVPRDEPVALLDFPNHSNVGDAAIWLGTTAWLRRSGRKVTFTSEPATWSPAALRRALGRHGTILVQGGGSLGDVWPERQRFREELIRSFGDHRVVQLPQTLFFSDPFAERRARKTLGAHPDLTVLCRDEPSLALARERLGLRAALCPDMAFGLDPPRRPRGPREGVLWLGRTDGEGRAQAVHPRDGLRRADWVAEAGARERRLERLLGRGLPAVGSRFARRAPRGLTLTAAPTARAYQWLAASRVARGVDLLGSARAVATDRLHAHLLCLLLEIPHAVVDTGYGKLTAFRDAWTHGADGVRWADSPAEAIELAEAL